MNISRERVNEVGNHQTGGIARDTPNLTFSRDSSNIDTKLGALMTGSADPPGNYRPALPPPPQ